MLNSKIYRTAALMLVLLMVLGLVACGGSGNKPVGGGQSNQPLISETDNTRVEPVATNPPDPSNSLVGLWVDAPGIFAFYDDFAFLYEFGSGDAAGLRFGYLKNLYDCSYTQNGDNVSVSVCDMEGELVFTGEYTLEGNILRDENNEFVKVSGNTGEEGNMSGTWYSLGDEFRLGDAGVTGDVFSGNLLRFYDDGTCSASWDDGSGRKDGKYVFTSKYDLPAITLYDEHGFELGTYPYEFLENDMLMIYIYDEDFGGYTFYRAS